MKPETLAAALTQWRAAFLTDTMPAAVIVDNHVLTLETTLLLAAENLDRGARYDTLVAAAKDVLATADGTLRRGWALNALADACAKA